MQIAMYPEALRNLKNTLMPNVLTDYLHELCQRFHRFYDECKIVGSDQQLSRLTLCIAADNIVIHGLFLLGISLPPPMSSLSSPPSSSLPPLSPPSE